MKNTFLSIFLLAIIGCASIKTQENVSNEYYLLGNDFFDLGKYDKAINSYLKSLEYNPKNQNSIINLILSYQKSNKFELAETTIYKYYKKRVSDFNNQLLFLLGNNFFLSGKYEKAIKIYSEYLKIKPEDPNALFNIGITYQKLMDEDTALDFFLKAYKINNDHKPSLYNIADYYYKKKEYNQSLNYFSKLEKLDPSNKELFYKLAEVEFLIEEYDLARKHISTAISLSKENSEYYILLARIYSKGFNDRKKTVETLENAFKNNFKDLNKLKTYSEFNLLFEYEDFKNLIKNYNLK